MVNAENLFSAFRLPPYFLMANPWSLLDPQQLKPSAASRGDLYTVPIGKEVTVTCINALNIGTTGDVFEISIAPGGVAHDGDLHPIEGGYDLQPGPSYSRVEMLTMSSQSVLRVMSTNGNVVFSMFGMIRSL